MSGDRWCVNCGQNVRPQRGQESGFVAFIFILVLGIGGAALGPTWALGLPEANARWLWAAIGVIVGCILVAVSAVIEATKASCPICGTRNLRRAG